MSYIIYLDTETTKIPDETKPTEDVLIQLGIVVHNTENNTYFTSEDMSNPKDTTSSVLSMALTNIVPEDYASLGKANTTKTYKILQKLIDEKECVLVAHNSPFDLEVLKRAGLNIKNSKIIDTLKVTRFINDSTGFTLWESNALQYLVYSYRLDKYRNAMKLKLEITSELKAHNAISDVIDLLLLTRKIETEFSASIEQMIEITKNPLLYKHFPYGSNKGKLLSELSENQLQWQLDNSDDVDVKFTCRKYLGV